MMPERRSRFVSNTVALITQMILATFITLLQVKILSNFLAKEDFGRFAALRGFSLLLSMLAVNGLPQLLVRFIPIHEARGERQRAMWLSVLSLAATMVLLAVFCGLAYAARGTVLAYVGVVTDELMLWLIVTTVAIALKQVLYGGFNGLRRLTVQVVLELLSLGAVLAWIVVTREALTLPLLFRILGTVNGLSVLVGMPIYLWMVANAHSDERAGGQAVGYGGYLLWASGISFVALAFTDVDRYLLAQVLSLELLALFHIGARVARLGHRLLGVPNLAFQPEITRISAEGRDDEISDTTRIFLKFNVAVAVIIAVGLSMFAREIIVVVASVDYLAAVPLMIILAATLPLATMTAPITTVMKALDQVRAALVVDLVWAVIYIGLIVALGPVFGLVGVGMASVGAAIAQLLVAIRTSRLSIAGGMITLVAGKLLLAAVLSWWPVVVADLLITNGGITVLVKVVLFVAGIVAYHWLMHWLRVFDAPERVTLADILESRHMGMLARLV